MTQKDDIGRVVGGGFRIGNSCTPVADSCHRMAKHITSWEIDGETVETVSNFIFLGSKNTADGDCSHEVKRCLLQEEKLQQTRIAY